jgi:hypothetical protein
MKIATIAVRLVVLFIYNLYSISLHI